MKLTAKDIVRALPFEDVFKRTLLSQYDTLPPSRRFAIDVLLTDTYETLYQLKVQEKLQLAFEKVRNGQFVLNENFYKDIRQEAEKEMREGMLQHTTESDLSAIRSKLQTYLKQN